MFEKFKFGIRIRENFYTYLLTFLCVWNFESEIHFQPLVNYWKEVTLTIPSI
jgi:hypothetical protein